MVAPTAPAPTMAILLVADSRMAGIVTTPAEIFLDK
jgi:hypothetical protein